MVIGVKYCGGCNSAYDRGRQVSLLKEQFPEHEYLSAGEAAGRECDVWLAVCGCSRACVPAGSLRAKKQVFFLTAERSFGEVREYLKKERNLPGTEKKEGESGCEGMKKRLRIGQEAAFSKTFYKDDVEKFAALTGDRNRLHTDGEFAGKSVYGRPVVHGVLAASLISTVMGMELPGEGTVLAEEQIRFVNPVFCGDRLTATVRFLSCRETKDRYIGTFFGICAKESGETVSWARCRQVMDKRWFEVENPEETAEEPEI